MFEAQFNIKMINNCIELGNITFFQRIETFEK